MVLNSVVEAVTYFHYAYSFIMRTVYGGPCGVLAAVQTFILKHLMFSDSSKPLNER